MILGIPWWVIITAIFLGLGTDFGLLCLFTLLDSGGADWKFWRYFTIRR